MATEKITGGVELGRGAAHETDALLLPFVRAATDEEAERLLSRVVEEHAAPVVAEVVRRKLRPHPARGAGDETEAEDVRHDALMHLLARLRRAKANPHEDPVGDLRGYAAVVATHACYRHLRRKHPRRHILKNRLRYLLTRQGGFALWEDDDGGELIAGFAAWRGQSPAARAAERLAQVEAAPASFVAPDLLSREAQRTRPAELLAAIFRHLGGPVSFDALVSTAAALWGVRDADEGRGPDELALVADGRAGADAGLETRDLLRLLWDELRQLPARQRAALLLNLRDAEGHGCIALLPLLGVATLRQLAEALEMPAALLAELWGSLPLDDARIAERMGLTRQQVINLRKAARARLARRLKGFG
jgi:RNA polymerase sigma factor (sigma-70 family)